MMDTGIYRGVPYEVYASWPGVRASTLTRMDVPARARAAMLVAQKPTPALVFGTHFHTFLLEPERFEREVIEDPECDRRTKEGKATWAAFEAMHAGKDVVPAPDMAAMRGMLQAIREHRTASELLSAPGDNEVCVVWDDQETGLRCKARLDRVCSWFGYTVVVDLKTAQSISDSGFSRAIANYDYHTRAAHYLAGLDALAPGARRFMWIACEKEVPYLVRVFEPTAETLERGRARWSTLLDTYAECESTGVWPGYPDVVTPIELPRWAA